MLKTSSNLLRTGLIGWLAMAACVLLILAYLLLNNFDPSGYFVRPAELARLTQPGWALVLTQAEESTAVQISIDYDAQSLAGIQAYWQANAQAAEQLFTQQELAPVVITFAKPLAIAEFETLAGKHSGLKTNRYIVRGVDEQGLAVTIGGEPTANSLISVERLKAVLTPANATVQGVIVVYGVVNAATYHHLLTTPEVYAVEVLESVARTEATRELPALGLANAELIYIEPPSLYAHLEALGGLPKR